MVTQFVLRSDKKDSGGRCPMHVVVYFDGARLKCTTGEKCKPADWNADNQKFRASFPLAEEANDLLKLMAGNVLAWWRKLRAASEAPTLEGLRAALRPAPAPEPEVVKQHSLPSCLSSTGKRCAPGATRATPCGSEKCCAVGCWGSKATVGNYWTPRRTIWLRMTGCWATCALTGSWPRIPLPASCAG